MNVLWLGLLALVAVVNAKSYSVVIPQRLVPGQPLPVSFSFLKAVDVAVQVDLLNDARNLIKSVTHTFKNGESGVLNVDVPANLPYQPTYQLLVHGLDGVHFFRRHDLAYDTASVKENLELFIQTDRALYKPGQTVRFRAFGMFTDLLVDTHPLNISIRDPKDNLIRKWTNITNSEYGVVESYLELDTEPVLGDWKIKVVSRDPYNVTVTHSKTFTVGKYVLPTFEVKVTMPTFILTSDKDVAITIKADYTYGKPVNGTVIVRADLSYQYTPWQNHPNEVMVETNVTIDGEVDVTIPLSRIANEYDPYSFVPLLSKLAGQRLEIDAIVTESLNGQVRHGFGDTQFYEAPFMLKFTDDHLAYFKPGLPYRASVNVAQADGRPVISNLQDVALKPYVKFRDDTVNSGYRARALSEQRFVPPSGGILDVTVDVPLDAKTLHLVVEYKGISTSLDVTISPQIQNGTMQVTMLSASAAINKEVEFKVNCTDGIETLQFMVMANDHAVHSGNVQMNGKKSGNFHFTVTKLMEPYAQLVVFYFNKNSVWSADSLTFEINDGSAIFRNNVSMSYNVSTAEPGEHVQLTVDTGAQSMVNVLAVDQSVLLMKTGNDLSIQDVTSALAVHGPSSAFTTIHVPRNVLSSSSELVVLSDIGHWGTQAKRQIDCGPTAMPGTFPPYLPGMVPSAAPGTFPPNEIPSPYPGGTYATGLYPTWVPGMVPTPAPGYTYAPNALPNTGQSIGSLQKVQHIRTKFPETFIWTNITSDDQGVATIVAEVPDTITSWVASAFSVSKTLGLGIADSKASFKSFRPFFVSLNLPYSVVRGEELVLQANAFNYLQQDLQVRVTLSRSDSFKVILPGQSGANHTYASQDVIRDISVRAGTAKSVFIPILPDKIGQVDLQVKAQSSMSADAVRRQLRVKPEGFELDYNRPVIMSTGDHVDMDLTTPKGTVPGSQIVHISAIGDIMGPSIPNMNKMLHLPTGCGEQTIATMAPDIFVTKYLEASGQMTDNIRSQALSFMEKGIQRELNFQRTDGSFSIWGNSDSTGSTWLTAFVLKTFAEAGAYVQVPELNSAMSWLYQMQQSDGSITRRGYVHSFSLQGGVTNSYSLTAFVAIALSKYDTNNDYYARRLLVRARAYLEDHVVNMTSPYDLAITSYALQLSGNVQAAHQAYQALDSKFTVTKDGLKYWTANPHHNSYQSPWLSSYSRRPVDIETVAYGLLYLAQSYHQISESVPVLKWLLAQRNANGGFASTQDTVVGLEALSRYRQLFGPANLDISVHAGQTFTANLHISTNDPLVLKTTRVPESEWTNGANSSSLPVTLTATGTGSALAQVSVSYHVREDSIKPVFNITTTVYKETLRYIEMTVVINRETSVNVSEFSGMTVVEMSIPSGFTLEPDTSATSVSIYCKKLEEKEGKIVLYFDEWYDSVMLIVKLIRTELVAKTQPVAILVYNYYKPYLRGLAFYQSKLLSDATFCDICIDCGC